MKHLFAFHQLSQTETATAYSRIRGCQEGQMQNLIFVLEHPPQKPLNIIAGGHKYRDLSRRTIISLAKKHLAESHLFTATQRGILIQPK